MTVGELGSISVPASVAEEADHPAGGLSRRLGLLYSAATRLGGAVSPPTQQPYITPSQQPYITRRRVSASRRDLTVSGRGGQWRPTVPWPAAATAHRATSEDMKRLLCYNGAFNFHRNVC